MNYRAKIVSPDPMKEIPGMNYAVHSMISRAEGGLQKMGYDDVDAEALWGILQRYPYLRSQHRPFEHLIRFYVEHPEWRTAWRKT